MCAIIAFKVYGFAPLLNHAVYGHNRERLLVASSGLELVIIIIMVRCLQMPSEGLVDLPVYFPVLDSLIWMACPGLAYLTCEILSLSKSPVRIPLLMPSVKSSKSRGRDASSFLMD